MSFGMVNDPTTLNRVFCKLLDGSGVVCNFIDDTLIHSPALEKHFQTIDKVLKQLRDANKTVNRTSRFFYYSVM